MRGKLYSFTRLYIRRRAVAINISYQVWYNSSRDHVVMAMTCRGIWLLVLIFWILGFACRPVDVAVQWTACEILCIHRGHHMTVECEHSDNNDDKTPPLT